MGEKKNKELEAQLNYTIKETSFLANKVPTNMQEFQLDIEDSIEINKNTKGILNFFEYTRRAGFKGQGPFKAKVVFTIQLAFTDEARKSLESQPEYSSQWIEDNKEKILETLNLPTKASAIITNMLIMAEVPTVITPPVYLDQKK